MASHWIKNTQGKPSASLTFVTVTFAIVMLHMLVSIFVNPFGLAINPFNASEAMIVLSPLLALYFGRRHTDLKETEVQLKHNTNKSVTTSEE